MKKFYVRALAATSALAILLPSCIDKNYDLDNLEKDMQVTLNDLALPLNIDDIQLGSIIQIDENDPNAPIQVINGEYCLRKTGTFSTKAIEIDRVSLDCTQPAPSSKEFKTGEYPVSPLPDQRFELRIGSKPTAFSLSSSAVPNEILDIRNIGCDLKLTITMGLEGFGDHLKGFRLHGDANPDDTSLDDNNLNVPFKMILPKGLTISNGPGSYNPDTGEYAIPATDYSGSEVELKIQVVAIDCAKAGIKFNAATHTLTFDGDLSLDYSTRVSIYGRDVTLTTMPAQIDYYTRFHIGNVDLTSFSGRVQYDIQDVDIPNVSLADLPDLLMQDETDIKLVNPQIFLNIANNPLAAYGLEAQTGLEISALRASGVKNIPMESPLVIKPELNSNYVICPNPAGVNVIPQGFETPAPNPQQFAGLADVLTGAGIPEALKIKLTDTCLPAQDVDNFQLGKPLDAITGDYCFFAPLQIAADSRIVYSATTNRWFDDGLSDIDITNVAVCAKASTDIPVALKLVAYPVDADKKPLAGVSPAELNLPANAKDFDVNVSFSGDLSDLNGMHYTAYAISAGGAALNKDMTISLKNVKVRMTGSMTIEFDEDKDDDQD